MRHRWEDEEQLGDWWDTISSYATAVTDWTKEAFQNRVNEWNLAVRDFQTQKAKLESNRSIVARSSDAKLKSEYSSMTERGWDIQSKIDTVTQKIKEALDWFRSQGSDISGLGLLPAAVPAIAIAAIVACMALMISYVNDAYVLNKKLEIAADLEKKGMSPGQALQTAQNIGPSSVATTVKSAFADTKVIMVAGAIGLALYLYISSKKK